MAKPLLSLLTEIFKFMNDITGNFVLDEDLGHLGQLCKKCSAVQAPFYASAPIPIGVDALESSLNASSRSSWPHSPLKRASD
ncbi:UNVERIFIED_CONTAM: hypothetical protein Slati_3879600 [Sesamum latifolium]|uniref:Uncharacterized protein n=1 Tax=Sesamum latifolium TaxID=2727402 RepID=A0AAW2TM07_9LAMI